MNFMLGRKVSMKRCSGVLFAAATTQVVLLSSSLSSSSLSCISSSFSSPGPPRRAFFGTRDKRYGTSTKILAFASLQRTAKTLKGGMLASSQGGCHFRLATAMFHSSTDTDNAQNKQSPLEEEMTKDALSITQAAIKAVDPFEAIQSHLSSSCKSPSGSDLHTDAFLHLLDRRSQSKFSYNLNDYDEIYIASLGKAASTMALATARIVTHRNNNNSNTSIPIRGKVITKDDHATADQIEELSSRFNITVHFASHPIPDERSVTHSMSLLQDLSHLHKRTLVINCISGGGSSVFCTPRPPLNLSHMSLLNKQLLASGMPITEMNVLRKKMEIGKGGGIVEQVEDANAKIRSDDGRGCDCITMVLSDVIGDPLDLIASGPTVRDESSWTDAWNLVERYELGQGERYELPSEVLDILNKGKEDEETNKQHDQDSATIDGADNCIPLLEKSRTVLVGNNALAVDAAASHAQKLGYNPVILGTTIGGEAKHIANMYVSMAEQVALQRRKNVNSKPVDSLFPVAQLPTALIAGGETVVTLPDHHGMGGRNQEIALVAALQLKKSGLRNVVLASIGTDGTDGPTDAAGAVVDGSTIDRIEYDNSFTCLGESSLQYHDAYTFLDSSDRHGALIRTGATGTNVADVCVILIK